MYIQAELGRQPARHPNSRLHDGRLLSHASAPYHHHLVLPLVSPRCPCGSLAARKCVLLAAFSWSLARACGTSVSALRLQVQVKVSGTELVQELLTHRLTSCVSASLLTMSRRAASVGLRQVERKTYCRVLTWIPSPSRRWSARSQSWKHGEGKPWPSCKSALGGVGDTPGRRAGRCMGHRESCFVRHLETSHLLGDQDSLKGGLRQRQRSEGPPQNGSRKHRGSKCTASDVSKTPMRTGYARAHRIGIPSAY